MKNINPIEFLTLRTGKLIAEPLFDKNKHPFDWNWTNEAAFGLGWRTFYTNINGIFHHIGITYDNVFNLSDKKNPRKIKAELYNCHYGKKYSTIHCVVKTSIDLNNIFKIKFVDDKTNLEFIADNYSLADFMQPNDKCYAHFGFNPYAVFGTGWKDWINPNYISVFVGDYEIDNHYLESDLFDSMERALRYKEKHLADLSEYTKINKW